jgi:hypothetical protein
MKKVHQAFQKGNKWVRKTKWELDVDDYIGAMVFIVVVGFVVIRTLIG